MVCGRCRFRPASDLRPLFQHLALWPHLTVQQHLEFALDSALLAAAAVFDRALEWPERLRPKAVLTPVPQRATNRLNSGHSAQDAYACAHHEASNVATFARRSRILLACSSRAIRSV